jgi:hypothetical protein
MAMVIPETHTAVQTGIVWTHLTSTPTPSSVDDTVAGYGINSQSPLLFFYSIFPETIMHVEWAFGPISLD